MKRLRRTEHDADRPEEAGFALADALTGLTILAATVVLSINAAAIARRASLSALDARYAARAIDEVLLVPFAELGAKADTTPVRWTANLTVDARLAGADAKAPCRRAVTVQSRGERRAYLASTLETCPDPKL